MGINITDKPEMNVVNIGDEITSDQLAGITNAASPTSENPFATMADVGGGDFLPLAGGTMTGDILFGTASQYIGEGNFDTERGGVNGLSLVCSVGYEFNWQAGWLTTTEQNSTTPRSLYLDGEAGTTLRVWNNTSNSGTHISTSELIFGTTVVEDNATWANTTVNSNGIAWTDFESYQAGGYNKLGYALYFYSANNPTFITASLDSAGSNNPNIQLQPDYGAYPAGSPVPMKIDGFGLTFSDGSYQSTAAVTSTKYTETTTSLTVIIDGINGHNIADGDVNPSVTLSNISTLTGGENVLITNVASMASVTITLDVGLSSQFWVSGGQTYTLAGGETKQFIYIGSINAFLIK